MKNLFVLALACGLAGCSALKSTAPPPTMYALHATTADAAEPSKTRPVILLPEPDVPAGFDTDRIALYLDNGRRMDFYAGAQWPDHLAKVLQGVILQTAAAQTAFTTVSPDMPARAAYRLQVRALDFEPVYAGGAAAAPQLKVTLNFRLLSLESDKIIMDTTYPETVAASANTQSAVVAGLEELLQKAVASGYDDVAAALPKRKNR